MATFRRKSYITSKVAPSSRRLLRLRMMTAMKNAQVAGRHRNKSGKDHSQVVPRRPSRTSSEIITRSLGSTAMQGEADVLIQFNSATKHVRLTTKHDQEKFNKLLD